MTGRFVFLLSRIHLFELPRVLSDEGASCAARAAASSLCFELLQEFLTNGPGNFGVVLPLRVLFEDVIIVALFALFLGRTGFSRDALHTGQDWALLDTRIWSQTEESLMYLVNMSANREPLHDISWKLIKFGLQVIDVDSPQRHLLICDVVVVEVVVVMFERESSFGLHEMVTLREA